MRKDFLDVPCCAPTHKAPYYEKVAQDATVSSRGVCANHALLGVVTIYRVSCVDA